MIGRSALYSLFFYLILAFAVIAQSYPNKQVDSLLWKGISEALDMNYAESKKTFLLLDKNYPGLPFGKINLAAIEITKSEDLYIDWNEDYIDSLLDLATEQSDSLLELNEDDLWYNYFKALSEGFLGYFNIVTKSYLAAYSHGLESVYYFNRCLEIDSAFAESYLAGGNLVYWKSAKSEFLHWLPFVEDQRELGIKYVEKSLETKTYNRSIGMYSLFWMYIDQKRYDDALSLMERALTLHPNSRVFKWELAYVYKFIDMRKSIRQYNELLESYEKVENWNRVTEVIIKHKIALLYEELDEFDKVVDICGEILKLQVEKPEFNDKLQERFTRVKDLLEKYKDK
ncbi:MAG: hypothetical protein K9J16_05840 [Melioribacteraceae bacterium]|nr:hypothetical protein [Melioribacteraceae bacterium]MCF8355266.1 hypothetical protein [Melioribacteraceae bacterium]MCF8394165.1 hypothetical protein [Melioribacteraceae bacterium]MCF8418848.1 hypothetical protein [Melioribacteraceae bacterium]